MTAWLEVECNRCKTRASLPAQRDPPAAGHADLEVGGLVQMPIMSVRPPRATGAHDQADRNAGDHALQVGASGRGALNPGYRRVLQRPE
jgi:hypothetical protein